MVKYSSILIIFLVYLGCSALPYKKTHLNYPTTNPEKICVIGDAGTGTKYQRRIALELEREKCEVVFYVGDIIYPAGIKNKDDYQVKKKFLRPYRKLLGADPFVPFYLVLGNHDYMGNPDAWIDISKKYEGKVIMPHHFYSGNWRDFCFVIIDTNTHSDYFSWKNREHREAQDKWLDELEPKLKTNCRFKLAFGHHPYKSTGSHGDAKKKLKYFLENKIMGKYDMYISGHDHNLAYEGIYQGTHLFVSGAGGKLRPLRMKHRLEDRFNTSKLGFLVLETNSVKKNKVRLKATFKYLDKGVLVSGYSKAIVN